MNIRTSIYVMNNLGTEDAGHHVTLSMSLN